MIAWALLRPYPFAPAPAPAPLSSERILAGAFYSKLILSLSPVRSLFLLASNRSICATRAHSNDQANVARAQLFLGEVTGHAACKLARAFLHASLEGKSRYSPLGSRSPREANDLI